MKKNLVARAQHTVLKAKARSENIVGHAKDSVTEPVFVPPTTTPRRVVVRRVEVPKD